LRTFVNYGRKKFYKIGLWRVHQQNICLQKFKDD
jgi:hypothetical protein